MSNRKKMIEVLKQYGDWWKEGDKVVYTKEFESDQLATVDFVHSDDMISIKFADDSYILVFEENIRRAKKIEIEKGYRFWRDPPFMHYTEGHGEHDD